MKRELTLLIKEANESFGYKIESDRSRRRMIYGVAPSIKIGKNHQAMIDHSFENVSKDRADQLILDPISSYNKEYVDKDVMSSCLKD